MSIDPNQPNTLDPQDSELERDLDSLRRQLANDQPDGPPAMLDQAILNRARRATEATTPRRRLGWIGAFATAAVAVLAFTVVLEQSGVDPELQPLPRSSEALHEEPVDPPPTHADEFQASSRQLHKVSREASPAAAPASEDNRLRMAGKAAASEMEEAPPAVAAELMEAPAQAAEYSVPIAADAVAKSEAEATKEDEDAAEIISPEQWIRQMLELKSSNQTALLETQLEAFIKAYPDYPLPQELREP